MPSVEKALILFYNHKMCLMLFGTELKFDENTNLGWRLDLSGTSPQPSTCSRWNIDCSVRSFLRLRFLAVRQRFTCSHLWAFNTGRKLFFLFGRWGTLNLWHGWDLEIIFQGIFGDRSLMADNWAPFFLCADREGCQVRVVVLDQAVQAQPTEWVNARKH